MARIAGVDLPRNKRMEVALTYIFGIGRPSARKILAEAGVDREQEERRPQRRRAGEAPPDHRQRYKVEGDLRRDVAMNIKRLHGSRLLPRPAASPQSAGARPAHAHQRPHPQGTAARHRRQEAAAVEGLGRTRGADTWRKNEARSKTR